MMMNAMSARKSWLLLAPLAVLSPGVAAQGPAEVLEVLSRVSGHVQDYYGRAQSIVCTERVMVQPINADVSSEGFARVLEYELRVDWQPADGDREPQATIVRDLKKVNGRAARPGGQPKCMDPQAISPEPLAFLLPIHRDEYVFSLRGAGRDGKRPALMLDYETRVDKPGRSEVTVKDDCTTFSVPEGARGRIWLDPATHDIMRLEQGLKRRFFVQVPYDRARSGASDFFAVERVDSSIRYRSVVFQDPDETVLLPESIESLVLIRGGGHLGNRTTQRFSDYRRFLTAARIVK
jgi:hypothetical protein